MRAMKALKTAILVAGLSVAMCFPAFATSNGNGPVSLEQLQEQAEQNNQAQTQAPTNSTGQGSDNSSSGIVLDDGASAISGIANSGRMDVDDPTAAKVGSVMNTWAAKTMQICGYIISIGLGLVIAIDLMFIAIPPLRGILSNGYAGSVSASQNDGNPYNNNSLNSMYTQNSMNLSAQTNNSPTSGRIQLVSNAALNAVTAASTGQNPFKIYLKEQLLTVIMAPAIYVLAATGILSRLGFFIGTTIGNWLGSLF